MKKKFIGLALALLVVLAVVGCGTTGLVITVDPDPLEFSDGTDLIEGTIAVTVTGFGSLTIDGVSVKIYRLTDGNEEEIFAYHTGQDEAFAGQFPKSVPFVAGNPGVEYEIQEFLGDNGYTVNDLINEFSVADIISYDDLKGEEFKLKVFIEGNPSASKTVDVIFY